MNNSVERLNKVFEISDLCYLQEKRKSIAKLNEKLEKEFQSFGIDYGSLKVYSMMISNTVKHLVNCRISFDIREVNSFIEKDIEKSIVTIAFKKIRERIIQTAEEEFQYLMDKVTDFSEDHHFPNKILEWIKEEIDNEKVEILKETKKDVEINQKRFELNNDISDLSEEQEKDYKKYEYKCYYKINIIGKDEDLKKDNYIEIDGNGVSLSENNFLIFMRLILERKISDEGWVNIEKFIEEIELQISGHYQLISRLRQNIQKILNEKETKKIIENKKSGLYRVSTHPDFIIYRKKDLMKDYSNNKYITQIVNQLPEI